MVRDLFEDERITALDAYHSFHFRECGFIFRQAASVVWKRVTQQSLLTSELPIQAS